MREITSQYFLDRGFTFEDAILSVFMVSMVIASSRMVFLMSFIFDSSLNDRTRIFMANSYGAKIKNCIFRILQIALSTTVTLWLAPVLREHGYDWKTILTVYLVQIFLMSFIRFGETGKP